MMAAPGLPPPLSPAPPGQPAPQTVGAGPGRALMLSNFVVSQLAWFAAVLGAAHGRPLAGTLCVLAAIGWHLAVVARPGREARLVLLVCLVGGVAETGVVALGHVTYPSGQPFAQWPPYWMVALWGLFAIALNVTLRWLRGRAWLAAGLGAVAGPLAFSAGVRLGGAQFVDASAALATLALLWALAMPLLMWLSVRFDGVTRSEPSHA